MSERSSAGHWILVVDDDSGLCELVLKNLGRHSHDARAAHSGKEALGLCVAGESPLLVLVDYRLPDMTGQDLVRALKEGDPDMAFVMMTGQGDEQVAVETMKLGASDYLIKDTELIDRIPTVVERVIRSIEIKRRLMKAEEGLRLAANVFTHSSEGILITDSNASIIEVNPAFTEITGYARDEVIGQNPRILNSGRQSKEYYASLWKSLGSTGVWNGEIWNRKKDGTIYAELLNISSVRDAQGVVINYIGQFSDITTLKEYQSQLERIAHYDSLTGLPNRLLLADRMMQAMAQVPRRERHIAIVYLDLDGFKAVNDAHGHETGDQLLAILAGRMTEALRDGDTLARLGGDEFVAVLVDLPEIDASGPILERLLEAASQPITVGDVVLKVSASLGVSVYPQEEEVDADQLLRQADQAMYQAKQAGKNRFHVFDSDHDRTVRGRYESLKHVQWALIHGEFELYYQPKVHMHTGEVVGVEALIRWNHPERGLLSPQAFLPIVENHPISIELGEWVIDTALRQIESWRAQGASIPVSVNVGALQLQEPEFARKLKALLRSHPNVREDDLELEILETSALEDISTVTALMETCRELGVGFALDDFGTGYSSLLYLKRLPASLIKIDQSFVRDMLDDPEDLAILEGVVGLATAFRRRLIAEGVETVAHGEILLCMGCELAQGYAIARPMPAREVMRWKETWKAPESWRSFTPISRDRLPELFAAVEHRSWISSIGNYVAGKRVDPPSLKTEQCRLCAMEFPDGEAESLHRETHRVASDVVADKQAGNLKEAQRGYEELRELGNRLFEALSGGHVFF